MAHALASEEVRQAFAKIGADARPATPEELAAYLVVQQKHWAGIVAATKLSVE